MDFLLKNKVFIFLVLCVFFCNSPVLSGSENSQLSDKVYMLTYDHGGLILWGPEHFAEQLRNAIEWLDRYPGYKIGLDNEAHIYDEFAENNPELLQGIKSYLEKYKGRFGIGTCTYGQPLSQFINEESNIRQIDYAIKADEKHLGYTPTI